MNTNTTAHEWVRTDPESVARDVLRLGFADAVSYNLYLAHTSEDSRWHGIGHDAMRDAIASLELRRSGPSVERHILTRTEDSRPNGKILAWDASWVDRKPCARWHVAGLSGQQNRLEAVSDVAGPAWDVVSTQDMGDGVHKHTIRRKESQP